MEWLKGGLLVLCIILTVGNVVMYITLLAFQKSIQAYYEEYIKPRFTGVPENSLDT